ncbi:drug/metabolite exporter YedA [Brevibacillus centrosporus]|jgi:drug/metabolite transporter (DMT)-like permease|uniref:Permease of the drug/metabolite transporter (DMT) superfamily n=1 Tax=Brevibacillus centrosporus TaxID=54910 RepID=A0A1I3LRJ9_9BACL|nr:drug/metabolite exporter YedA [Brevibacillus centrosporus]MED4906852.1 drug/metabolite exporter YedA [Brevibacillus centrosporus]SFI87414.1 Permease of the drug/metabolite transporter (DMT) superfamily [Brevibacillus centrosporus]
MTGKKDTKLFAITIALLTVYLFWGGTYLGMKIAIESIPPFIMAGVRFTLAGVFLFLFSRLKGAELPSAAEWKGAGIVGALLLLGGNGVVAWAELRLPSAIASLLVATVPLWILVLNWAGGSRQKPSGGVMAGILVGLAGVAVLVVHPGGSEGKGADTIGIIVLLAASISWSFGSLYSRTAKLPASPLMSTALQMIVGGILLSITSLFLDDWTKLHVTQISLRSWVALGYLIVFGSILAYTAYIWLLKNAEPSLVSTYAFVNPIVAVFLGWLLADEQLSTQSWVAAALIIAAVAIITIFRGKGARQNQTAARKEEGKLQAR